MSILTLANLCLCYSIDNSESSRNGDFAPNRLLAQQEASQEILRIQLRSNPESNVALMTTAGRQPNLLVPLCSSQVALQKKLYSVQVGGTADPIKAIQIAQLVLKHRQGRQNGQRVVIFIGPLSQQFNCNGMSALGHSLRKHSIFLDLVVFGNEAEEVAQTSELFQPLMVALGTNCQLVTALTNQCLTDVVLGEMRFLIGAIQHSGPAVMGNEGSDDPELMLAIQMSLQDINKQQDTSKSETSSPLSNDSIVKAKVSQVKEAN